MIVSSFQRGEMQFFFAAASLARHGLFISLPRLLCLDAPRARAMKPEHLG